MTSKRTEVGRGEMVAEKGEVHGTAGAPDSECVDHKVRATGAVVDDIDEVTASTPGLDTEDNWSR